MTPPTTTTHDDTNEVQSNDPNVEKDASLPTVRSVAGNCQYNSNDTTTPTTTTMTTNGATTVTGLPLDWTSMGATADEALPLRYPHDVAEWSIEDTEISIVGTAGQKITVLGNDFDVDKVKATTTTKNNTSNVTNPKLKSLILRSHLIKEMAGLGGLKHLTLLELYDNMVQSLDEESLKGCGPTLRVLDMSYNAIRDMEPVKFCSPIHLTELYLANNKLKTMAGLGGLTNLKKMDLGANRIRVIDGNELRGLVNLEELWIGKNKIEEILGLEKLTKLRRLDVQSNRLTKVENLESQVESLEELYLSHNGIDDEGASMATGLALCFPKLNMLDLSRNRLTTTAPFTHLSTLEELWLSGNEMESFDSVAPLHEAAAQGHLPTLETIYLEYNPLASDFEYRKKLAEWIPSLKQIDATMIGGLASHGMAPASGTAASSTVAMGGAAAASIPTEERLRHLQAAAIERARQQQQQQQQQQQKDE